MTKPKFFRMDGVLVTAVPEPEGEESCGGCHFFRDTGLTKCATRLCPTDFPVKCWDEAVIFIKLEDEEKGNVLQ